ncbi:MAG: AraC family transcriptional regulator [Actinomycetota bacterium]
MIGTERSSPIAAAAALPEVVARHAPTDGTHETPIEGVRLFRVSAPVDRVPGVYDPSVCAVVSGSKHAYHDGRTHTYGPGHYLCTTMPIPLEAEVPNATGDRPVLGVLIDLDTRPMTEFLIQYRAARPRTPGSVGPGAGLTVAPWDQPFTVALLRVLELLDDAPALDLLAPGRLRELLYAVVQGAGGAAILGSLGASTHQLAPVLTYMRNNLDQPLAVEDLADRAGMSRAAFDRHFKAVTALSPLKYLKALRLNDAAMLIANGATMSHAASRVGYTSPSQFSREFKRHFGTTPRAWAGAPGAADPQAATLS